MNRRAFISSVAALSTSLAVAPKAIAAERITADIVGMDLAGGSDSFVVFTPIDGTAQRLRCGPGSADLRLGLDMSEIAAQAADLRSLLLEAGDVPESILQELRGLVERDGLVDEIEWRVLPAARGADEYGFSIRFRDGGAYDRVRAAVRALRTKGNV